jgi:hypothetical protein
LGVEARGLNPVYYRSTENAFLEGAVHLVSLRPSAGILPEATAQQASSRSRSPTNLKPWRVSRPEAGARSAMSRKPSMKPPCESALRDEVASKRQREWKRTAEVVECTIKQLGARLADAKWKQILHGCSKSPRLRLRRSQRRSVAQLQAPFRLAATACVPTARLLVSHLEWLATAAPAPAAAVDLDRRLLRPRSAPMAWVAGTRYSILHMDRSFMASNVFDSRAVWRLRLWTQSTCRCQSTPLPAESAPSAKAVRISSRIGSLTW